MYCSNPDEEIFQRKPVFSKPSTFRPKSWCDTTEGYLHEAKKLTTLLIRNRKLMGVPYRWFLTIYVDFHQSPQEVSAWWTKATRNLKAKRLNALWVREPTRSNKVHYHLLVRNNISKADLTAIVEESLPSRKLGRWHKNIKPVGTNDWRLLHYITKAKLAGKTKKGAVITDLYAKKRMLFKKKLGIRKVGTIGKFWAQKKSALWKQIVEKEKKIADGLSRPNVKRLARHAHEFIEGAVPLKQIERNFGYYSDSLGVKSWIDRLYGHEERAQPMPA
jgi:hypothetical protein